MNLPSLARRGPQSGAAAEIRRPAMICLVLELPHVLPALPGI